MSGKDHLHKLAGDEASLANVLLHLELLLLLCSKARSGVAWLVRQWTALTKRTRGFVGTTA